MGTSEINAFLTDLAANGNVTASTKTRPSARWCFSTGTCSSAIPATSAMRAGRSALRNAP